MNTKAFVLLLITIFGLLACKKNNDAPSATLTTTLNLINVSADTVNFYLNGTRLDNNSNLYPGGASGYITVAFGTQNYQVKKLFNPAKNIVQTLFSIPLTLDTSKRYSLFIAGETAADAFTSEDPFLIDTTQNVSYVRFINASPDADSFDVTIGDTSKFKNKEFKSVSDYQAIGSGRKSIKLYHTGNSTVIDTLALPMASQGIYTIYTKGRSGGTGNSALILASMLNLNQ